MYGYGGGGSYWAVTPSSNDGNGSTSGGNNGTINGVAGTTNRGAGGGGGAFGSTGGSTPGAGGSGVVILKYPDSYTITIGAGLTGTTGSPAGGFKTTTITAGTGNVSWA
jgi:hypothetical protein